MSETIKTTCPYCGVGCGVRASVEAGGGVAIAGDESHPANTGRLCSKGTALGETLDLADRLLHPEIGGRRTDWDTALDAVADGFSRVVAEHGPEAVAFYVSGQLLTEDYYVANKLMKGFIGGANIDTNSRLCMSSAVAGHGRAFGEDVVPGCYADLEGADLIVLVGANTAWCHPIVYRRIEAARAERPDTRLVVIDPRRTATAEEADLHLPVAPGWDVALFNGLLAHLERAGRVDAGFVEARTTGAAEALAAARAGDADPAALARATGVPEADLRTFLDWFADTPNTVTVFSQGVNQSVAGSDKVNAIINCHLLTGRIGKPGAGPFSITGQPNAMGGREVGGLASTLAAHRGFDEADTIADFWHAPNIARQPGLKAVDLFEAIGDGHVKAVWIMATNPAVSMPDADAVRRALAGCDLVVVSDCMAATDTARLADIRLPAATWGEKDGTVTNSERTISRQRPFLPLPGEARPDWWIVTQVARRLGHAAAFPYEHPHEIFTEHAALSAHANDGRRLFDIGGLAGLTRADYDALTPVQWPVSRTGGTGNVRRETENGKRKTEDGEDNARAGDDTFPVSRFPSSVPKRLFLDGRFPTDDGRARFVAVTQQPPAHAPDENYPLTLNTGRLRDHWHTMTRTAKSPRLSGHIPEPCVSVHPRDAQVAGLTDGHLAELRSHWGRMLARVAVDEGQRRGSLFAPIHWNAEYAAAGRVGALVNPVVDPVSGEPEFKHTPVAVAPWAAAWHGFVLARAPLTPPAEADYWIRVHGEAFERYELAGAAPPAHWPLAARALFGVDDPDADWIEYSDPRAGHYRAAWLRDGALVACLFAAPRPPALPDRSWLAGLFAKGELDADDRIALLTGRPADPEADAGPAVCSCFGVGRKALADAIRERGLATPEAVGEALGAGTNCGSCLPEIRTLLREARPSAVTEGA
ncbi:Nitrate reductase [Salinisphaera sp. PC39]|uniref:molybdopterin-dependent oxidoreductase n=1 Tax=Salinisphaera sp. PC39 TaxID=1304156 RepID=UPI00333E8D44